MRYVLDVSYDGSLYSGWQLQDNAHTVQEELEKTLRMLFREEVQTYGAGRTDTGVHAIKLPVHFDFDEELHPHFFKSVNAILPKDISVKAVYKAVRQNFHARFDAISRAYRYQVIFDKDPLLYGRALWYKEELDLELMQQAAGVVMEYDSFETFCKANANNKTFFCKITRSEFGREGKMLVYHVRADRFLRGMVRTLMGTFLLVGKGQMTLDELRKVIEAKDRKQAGPSVQPHGLFLSEVDYKQGELIKIFGQ